MQPVAVFAKTSLLLLENNDATKWSTGPVWEHPKFAETLDSSSPENERVVGLIFYGYLTNQAYHQSTLPLIIT